MNIAEEVIDWLYTDQLRIEEQWSYLLPAGFTWWSDRYAQTVEFVGEETGPSGESGYLVCVRTELLRDVDLTDAALEQINMVPMRCAALAGPVYDAAARRLDLWSLVRLTDDNGGWMRYLLAAAAVTQIAEARLLAPVLGEAVGALPATSEHPESGARTLPGEMSSAAGIFVRSGDEACAWPETEFHELLTGGQPPAVAAGSDGLGVAVEFAFGELTSSCRVLGDQQHPLYGNGLLVLQRFPVDIPRAGDPRGSDSGGAESADSTVTDSKGIALALALNAADLTREAAGYGLGSYSYADGAVHFSGFVPNALYKPGLLPNLYASAAARAQRMAARFVDGGWDPEAYSLDAAVLARRREQRQAEMPAVEPMRGCPMMRARAGGS